MVGKRDILARGAHIVGLLRVLEWLPRRSFFVLDYHRIMARGRRYDQAVFDEGVFSCTEDDFIEQIGFLRERCNVISVADLRRARAQRTPLPPHAVLLTFDDGYVDNYDLVFPLLKQKGLTGCFALPTQRLRERRLEWWDLLAWMAKAAAPGVYEFSVPQPATLQIPDGDRTAAAWQLQSLVKNAPNLDYDQFIAHVAERLGTGLPDEALQSSQIMTFDQARKMAAAGMEFASHGHSHRILGLIPGDEQRRELVTSKQILEAELGRPVETLIYPVGGPGHYTEETKRLAREAGYQIAFSLVPWRNLVAKMDMFDVGRRAADRLNLLRFRAMIAGLM